MPQRGPKAALSLVDLTLTPRQERSFWAHVVMSASCWLWIGSVNAWGYGRCVVGTERRVSTRRSDGGQYRRYGRTRLAHRVAYRLVIGPIPRALDLDHVRQNGCVNKNCVRPAHLEPVTSLANCIRDDVWRGNREKTHCPHGHAYVESNVRMFNGSRHCKACNRECARRLRRERKELKKAA